MRVSDPDAVLVAVATVAFLANGAALSSERTPFSARRPPRAEIIGEFASVFGSVKTHGAGSLVWDAVRPLDDVHQGDAVFTGPDAQVTLRLADGSSIELAPSTFVVIGRDTSPSIRIARGSVGGLAGSRGLRVDAGTSESAIAARSRAAVHVAPSGSRIEVAQGRVDVTGSALAASQQVAGRQAIEIGASGTVSRTDLPVVLTWPSPGATIRFRGKPEAIDFAWMSGLPHDLRIEIARDQAFAHVVLDARVTTPGKSFVPPTAGAYRWRVLGDEGVPVSEARSFLVLEDLPPRLAQPLDDEVIFVAPGEQTTLAWRAGEPVRVEIAADPSFAKPVVAESAIAGNRLAFAPPEGEGRWHWRVRAARDDAPWSEPRPFRITRVDGNAAPLHLNEEVLVDAP